MPSTTTRTRFWFVVVVFLLDQGAPAGCRNRYPKGGTAYSCLVHTLFALSAEPEIGALGNSAPYHVSSSSLQNQSKEILAANLPTLENDLEAVKPWIA